MESIPIKKNETGEKSYAVALPLCLSISHTYTLNIRNPIG